jgi:hypothetical protein
MDQIVIESDAVAMAVQSFTAARAEWTGTAAELLPLLAAMAGEAAAGGKTWPQTPRALSGRLRRAAPALRRAGIGIEFGERTAAARRITLRAAAAEKASNRPSPPSPPSSAAKMLPLEDDGTDPTTVIGRPPTVIDRPPAVMPPPQKSSRRDGDDGDDGRIPALSTGDEERPDRDPEEAVWTD